jgi:hypothetical protein
MSTGDPQLRDRAWLLAVGLLLVTMPAVTLVVAYAVLRATRSVLLEGVTPVEVVEIYLIELGAFAAFSYLLYRLTTYTIRRQAGAERDQGSTDDLPPDRS